MERAAVIRLPSSPHLAVNASVHQPSGHKTALFAPEFNGQPCSSASTGHYLAKEPTAHSTPMGRQPRSRRASGPHTCPQCGKTLGRKYELVCHLRGHTGEKPFECSECGKKFAKEGNLKRHLRAHARAYACGLCGETFTTRKRFKAHSRTHSPVRSPHECQECHETFSRLSDLSAHRIAHTREKHYECHICHKWCASKHGFTAHLRTHQNVAGLKCSTCKRKFLYRWLLLAHMREKSCTSTESAAVEMAICVEPVPATPDLTESAAVETTMCLEPVPVHDTPDFVWYSNACSF